MYSHWKDLTLPIQISHSARQDSNSPLTGQGWQSNAHGLPGEGMWKLRNDRRIRNSLQWSVYNSVDSIKLSRNRHPPTTHRNFSRNLPPLFICFHTNQYTGNISSSSIKTWTFWTGYKNKFESLFILTTLQTIFILREKI